jgi:hypothetical protein
VAFGLPFDRVTYANDKVSNSYKKTYSGSEKFTFNRIGVNSSETQVNECNFCTVICVH